VIYTLLGKVEILSFRREKKRNRTTAIATKNRGVHHHNVMPKKEGRRSTICLEAGSSATKRESLQKKKN